MAEQIAEAAARRTWEVDLLTAGGGGGSTPPCCRHRHSRAERPLLRRAHPRARALRNPRSQSRFHRTGPSPRRRRSTPDQYGSRRAASPANAGRVRRGAGAPRHAAPGPPGPARTRRPRLPPLGHDPGDRLRRERDHEPDQAAVIDADGAVTWRRARPAHQRARAGLRRVGADAGERIGILCRNGAALVESVFAVRQARRARADAEHLLLGGRAEGRARPRAAAGAGVRRGVRVDRGRRVAAGTKRLATGSEFTTLRDQQLETAGRPAARGGSDGDPDLGHDRPAEGRADRARFRPRAARVVPERRTDQRGLDVPHPGAAVPRARPRPVHDRDGARVHGGAARGRSTPRRRSR